MIAASGGGLAAVLRARPLRFLAMTVGLWVVLRVALIGELIPRADLPLRVVDAAPRTQGAEAALGAGHSVGTVPPPGRVSWPVLANIAAPADALPLHAAGIIARPQLLRPDAMVLAGAALAPRIPVAAAPAAMTGLQPLAPVRGSGNWSARRHGVRYALIAPYLQPGRSAPLAADTELARPGAMLLTSSPPRKGQWNASAWVFLRQGRGPTLAAGTPQLGGSQLGLRVERRILGSTDLRLHARASTSASRSGRDAEAALGLSLRPVRQLPVTVQAERRIAIGPDGRSAFAVAASGGVSDVDLGQGVHLDAYAQAGIVGARRRDGFVDGAVVVDRRLTSIKSADVRLGVLAAGGAQPGASRIDVGPRLSVRLPTIGEGGRVAVDWRQRIAGTASPRSGVALTLAADF